MKKLITLAFLAASIMAGPVYAQSGPSSGPGSGAGSSGSFGTNADNLGAIIAGNQVGLPDLLLDTKCSVDTPCVDQLIARIQTIIAQLNATGGSAAGPAVMALNNLLAALKKG